MTSSYSLKPSLLAYRYVVEKYKIKFNNISELRFVKNILYNMQTGMQYKVKYADEAIALIDAGVESDDVTNYLIRNLWVLHNEE